MHHIKPWYQSKTLWAAVITGIIGVATAVAGEGLVSEQVAGGILIGVGLLNTLLRMVTTEPLGL
jgi:uncharacterized membrane protein